MQALLRIVLLACETDLQRLCSTLCLHTSSAECCTPRRDCQKLWAAASLLTQYDGRPCTLTVRSIRVQRVWEAVCLCGSFCCCVVFLQGWCSLISRRLHVRVTSGKNLSQARAPIASSQLN